MDLEYIKSLILEKEKKLTSNEERKQINIIKEFIKIPNCFFNIPIESAVGMLDFLGVPEEQIQDLYFELISPNNYQTLNGTRLTISKEK